MVPPEICVSRKVGLGGVVLFPEQQGTGYPSLKPRYLFHSTPKHLPTISAETLVNFQHCLLGTHVEHGVASYCHISIVTNWFSHMLQVAASRCVN